MLPDPLATSLRTALAHHQAGRLADAESLYRDILRQRPNHPDALHLLGTLALQSGRTDAAADLLHRALAAQPANPIFHATLGNIYLEQSRLDDAIASYERAISLQPTRAEFHNNLSNALKQRGRLDESSAAARRALQLNPQLADAHLNLGNALRAQGNIDEALAAYHQARALNPNNAATHNNLGNALRDLARLDEASAAYRQAIALQPDYADAHSNLALLLLHRGDFAAGWPEHEWRWHCRDFLPLRRDFSQPQWDGSPLAGRTILLHAEQGLGDTLQFFRYIPLVAAQARRVLLECPPELHRLFQRSATHDNMQLLTRGQPFPPFDLHCPLLSLPLAFHTTLETIPHQVPYLHADPALIQHWRNKLAQTPAETEPRVETRGQRTPILAPTSRTPSPSRLPITNYHLPLKVGLAWAGRKQHANDHNRSLPLAAFAPLAAIPNLQFYSLQKGDAAAQSANPPPGMHLIDFTSDLRDFADTAALIANLDLILSVDTSIVHLAGALAKPTWTLLSFAPDWRWLQDRADSPWYPTVRLFRQPKTADWPAVLRQVAAALAQQIPSAPSEHREHHS